MLKNLEPAGADYLTKVPNLSLVSLKIPGLQKIGTVRALKQVKQAKKEELYQPISLILSPAAQLYSTS